MMDEAVAKAREIGVSENVAILVTTEECDNARSREHGRKPM
jgi:hypothetical protein